ncbi:hypothetical protein [Jiangella endophytica]|uniref:hypothetical protein n=1 Tax=Jiangella endophytica TaxID=1623398 RepID=UPI0013005698|nr:hypothetical protein [Jiangella endophytica]
MKYSPVFKPRSMPQGSQCGTCGEEFEIGDFIRWEFDSITDKVLIHAYKCLGQDWASTLGKLEWPNGSTGKCPVPEFEFSFEDWDRTYVIGNPTSATGMEQLADQEAEYRRAVRKQRRREDAEALQFYAEMKAA